MRGLGVILTALLVVSAISVQAEVIERAGLQFIYHPDNERHAKDLIETSEAARKHILADIGEGLDSPVEVRLAGTQKTFAELMPEGYTPPEWAAGIAFPRLNLIVIRLDQTQEQVRLTFIHELSHIALYRATDFKPLPKWFIEGFAIVQADEFSFQRTWLIVQAALGNSIIPLRDLSRRFPQSGRAVNLAYAQSCHFVGWLIHEYGRERFQQFLGYIRSDYTFFKALERAYHMPLEELEEEWISEIRLIYSWIPLITGSATLWFAISLLFLLGYLRRRRRTKRILKKWEEEEEEQAI